MAGLDITARVGLEAPTNANLQQIVDVINRQLSGIKIPISIDGAPATLQIDKIKNSLSGATKGAQDFGDAIALSARRAVAYSIAAGFIFKISNAFAEATTSAIRFRKEVGKLAQTFDTSLDSIDTKAIVKISKDYGLAATKVGELVRILGQAGFSFKEAAKGAELLSRTTLLASFDNVADTTEGLIALTETFNLNLKQTEKALESINVVSKKYAVESADLVSAIKRTGGVFAVTGGNVEELIALITKVRSTTRESADTIATGFRTIFSRLQRPKTIEFLRNLGIELEGTGDRAGQFVGNFEAIARISEGLQKNKIKPGSLQFAEIVEEIGGLRQVSRVIPLLTNFSRTQEILNEANRAGAESARDAAKAQETLAFKIEALRQKFFALVIGVTETGTFKAITDQLLFFSNVVLSLTERLTDLIPLITGLFAGRLIGNVFSRLNQKGTFSGFFGFNDGGFVPGSGNTDNVPALLTPGEFVINKASAQAYGYDKLSNINKYAKGGRVGRARFAEGGPVFGERDSQKLDTLLQLIEEQLVNEPKERRAAPDLLESNEDELKLYSQSVQDYVKENEKLINEAKKLYKAFDDLAGKMAEADIEIEKENKRIQKEAKDKAIVRGASSLQETNKEVSPLVEFRDKITKAQKRSDKNAFDTGVENQEIKNTQERIKKNKEALSALENKKSKSKADVREIGALKGIISKDEDFLSRIPNQETAKPKPALAKAIETEDPEITKKFREKEEASEAKRKAQLKKDEQKKQEQVRKTNLGSVSKPEDPVQFAQTLIDSIKQQIESKGLSIPIEIEEKSKALIEAAQGADSIQDISEETGALSQAKKRFLSGKTSENIKTEPEKLVQEEVPKAQREAQTVNALRESLSQKESPSFTRPVDVSSKITSDQQVVDILNGLAKDIPSVNKIKLQKLDAESSRGRQSGNLVSINPSKAYSGTVLHETGHALDYQLSGGDGYSSRTEGTFQNEIAKVFKNQVRGKELERTDPDYANYRSESAELFADLFARLPRELQILVGTITDATEGFAKFKEAGIDLSKEGDLASVLSQQYGSPSGDPNAPQRSIRIPGGYASNFSEIPQKVQQKQLGSPPIPNIGPPISVFDPFKDGVYGPPKPPKLLGYTPPVKSFPSVPIPNIGTPKDVRPFPNFGSVPGRKNIIPSVPKSGFGFQPEVSPVTPIPPKPPKATRTKGGFSDDCCNKLLDILNKIHQAILNNKSVGAATVDVAQTNTTKDTTSTTTSDTNIGPAIVGKKSNFDLATLAIAASLAGQAITSYSEAQAKANNQEVSTTVKLVEKLTSLIAVVATVSAVLDTFGLSLSKERLQKGFNTAFNIPSRDVSSRGTTRQKLERIQKKVKERAENFNKDPRSFSSFTNTQSSSSSKFKQRIQSNLNVGEKVSSRLNNVFNKDILPRKTLGNIGKALPRVGAVGGLALGAGALTFGAGELIDTGRGFSARKEKAIEEGRTEASGKAAVEEQLQKDLTLLSTGVVATAAALAPFTGGLSIAIGAVALAGAGFIKFSDQFTEVGGIVGFFAKSLREVTKGTRDFFASLGLADSNALIEAQARAAASVEAFTKVFENSSVRIRQAVEKFNSLNPKNRAKPEDLANDPAIRELALGFDARNKEVRKERNLRVDEQAGNLNAAQNSAVGGYFLDVLSGLRDFSSLSGLNLSTAGLAEFNAAQVEKSKAEEKDLARNNLEEIKPILQILATQFTAKGGTDLEEFKKTLSDPLKDILNQADTQGVKGTLTVKDLLDQTQVDQIFGNFKEALDAATKATVGFRQAVIDNQINNINRDFEAASLSSTSGIEDVRSRSSSLRGLLTDSSSAAASASLLKNQEDLNFVRSLPPDQRERAGTRTIPEIESAIALDKQAIQQNIQVRNELINAIKAEIEIEKQRTAAISGTLQDYVTGDRAQRKEIEKTAKVTQRLEAGEDISKFSRRDRARIPAALKNLTAEGQESARRRLEQLGAQQLGSKLRPQGDFFAGIQEVGATGQTARESRLLGNLGEENKLLGRDEQGLLKAQGSETNALNAEFNRISEQFIKSLKDVQLAPLKVEFPTNFTIDFVGNEQLLDVLRNEMLTVVADEITKLKNGQ